MAKVFDISVLAGTIAAAKDRAVAKLGEYGVNEALGGHVLPPLPPFPGSAVSKMDGVQDGYPDMAIQGDQPTQTLSSIFNTPMCFPLKLKPTHSQEDMWLLPVEPLITIGGGTTLARRNVAKATNQNRKLRGTIKERWAQDDYQINIEGLLTKYDEWSYPQQDVKKLWSWLELGDTFDVECELFEIFHISRIAVEKWDFPFTKGVENQAYRLTCYSDDPWELFIEMTQKSN